MLTRRLILKANYTAEYITAFLTIHAGELEKTASAVAECRRLDINVLPPDINHSQLDFSIEADEKGQPAIRFGLGAIKNVGAGAIEPVIKERNKNGAYKSIEDFCRRGNLQSINRRVMESLIKAGALDCLGDRGALLNSVTRIISLSPARAAPPRNRAVNDVRPLWTDGCCAAART